MTTLWPWLAIAGLGAFHGANPAMGWLFAVALGLHRHSRAVVGQALVPIALGHAASIAIVALAFVFLGLLVDTEPLLKVSGALLIAWALWHAVWGHGRRVRFGMQVGMVGLGLWSFLMASAHGAGLMLIPALAPLCLAGSPGAEVMAEGSFATAAAAVGLHTLSMLAVTAAFAFAVYGWLGLEVLRRGWLNLDAVWTAALVVCGVILLL